MFCFPVYNRLLLLGYIHELACVQMLFNYESHERIVGRMSCENGRKYIKDKYFHKISWNKGLGNFLKYKKNIVTVANIISFNHLHALVTSFDRNLRNIVKNCCRLRFCMPHWVFNLWAFAYSSWLKAGSVPNESIILRRQLQEDTSITCAV